MNDKNDKKTYGAVLYLDGKRLNAKRTFSSRCLFSGFPLGGGTYQRFVFNMKTNDDETEE